MSAAALAYPQKSAEAFRTISEVAQELDVPQHVLRFWESRFTQIKPVKRAGGRRYYRPDDVDLLKGIRALLYNDGFTIKGVQKVLKERGLRHVAELGRTGAAAAAPPAPVVIEKIVYVEKPAPAPVKKRPTHLRAVPDISLPLFDEPAPGQPASGPFAPVPVAEAPQVAEVQQKPEPLVQAAPADTCDRVRLDALLDELTGLKMRLRTARSA